MLKTDWTCAFTTDRYINDGQKIGAFPALDWKPKKFFSVQRLKILVSNSKNLVFQSKSKLHIEILASSIEILGSSKNTKQMASTKLRRRQVKDSKIVTRALYAEGIMQYFYSIWNCIVFSIIF